MGGLNKNQKGLITRDFGNRVIPGRCEKDNNKN